MRRACLALILAVWAALAGAQALPPVPALSARVTDLAAILDAGQRDRLEDRLAAFEREKGVQIAVLLVPTTQPESIEQYALRVAEQWRLGRQGVDDGVLLLVARDDRKLRIEVGYGLEGALNDATAKRIVAETIAPHFRERDFYAGIAAGVEGIVAAIGGEPLPPPRETERQAGGGGSDFEDIFVLGLVLLTFVAGILRAIFGRFLGALIVGGIAGFIVMLVAASLVVAVLAGVVAFFLALLGGGGSGRGGWGGPGGFSRGGSGGRGLGGFSGGGGRFGGGGASGGW